MNECICKSLKKQIETELGDLLYQGDAQMKRAVCSQCSHEVISIPSLPFFRHNEDYPRDMFYCGCRGWD